MKALLSILQLLLFTMYLCAQGFQKTYGGTGDERGHAIIVTGDGGFAVAGQTTSFGAGGDDIFIMKLDAFGEIEWQKTYGSAEDEYGFGIAMTETPDGGFIVTGLGRGVGSAIADFYLFKVDSNGNLLWDNVYDSGPSGTSGDHGRGFLQTQDGNILIFGTDDSNTFGSNEGVILKIDENGNLIWKRIYGGNANEHLQEGIELPSGNVMACGSCQSFGPGNVAAYVVKINRAGNLIWARAYGGSGFDAFNSCLKTPDNGMVATGVVSSFGAGQSDILLSRIDSSGTVVWTKTFGGTRNERGASVKAVPDNTGYVITAYTQSFGRGSRDILLIRTDIDGNLIWSKVFGTSDYEAVNEWANTCLTLTPQNEIVFTGWSDSLSVSGEDILVIKTDDQGDQLCSSANVITGSPTMQVVITNTQSAIAGSYLNVSSTVMNASFETDSICYCIPQSLCQCPNVTSHITASGDIDCTQPIVVLTASPMNPSVKFLWMDASQQVLSDSSSLFLDQAGQYFLLTIDTTSGCESLDSHFVTDHTSIPLIDAGEDRQIDCRDTSVTLEANKDNLIANAVYSWSGPPNSFETNPTHRMVTVLLPGEYIVTVIDTINGCTNRDTLQVADIRDSPIAEAGSDQILECDTTVLLDGSMSSVGLNFQHIWNGPGIQNASTISVEAFEAGWYYLLVTNILNGCESIDSVKVTPADPARVVSVTVIDPECNDDSTGYSLHINPQGGAPPFTYTLNGIPIQSPDDLNGFEPGEYDISVSDQNMCKWDSAIVLPQITMLSVYLGVDLVLRVGQNHSLSANITGNTDIDSIVWNPAELLSCASCADPELILTAPDTLHITVTVYADGCIASDAILLIINEKARAFIPNVFSPNHDNVNDYITVFSNDPLAQVLEFTIFDRWGEMVFRGSNFPVNVPELGWNGQFKDKPMNPGVFVYVAEIAFQDLSFQVIHGDITLVR